MTRVLITGGAGFIGYHLARRISEDGCEVDLIDSLARGVEDDALSALLDTSSVRLFRRDLREANAFDGLGQVYDVIFHLAAIVGVSHVLERPYAVLEENVALNARVIEFARRVAGPTRLVFVSTSEVYAGTLEHYGLPLPTPESTPLALPALNLPRTSYMLSKLYGEAMCHQAGVPFTIVRPHNVYGPRMGLSHVIPELLQRAHAAPEGGKLPVYSVEHTRTFCYVDDAVAMLVRVASTPACAGVTLNLGRELPEVSIGEVARIVVEVVGKDLTIVPQPPTQGSPSRRCPDMTSMLALTSYEASIEVEVGIRRTYDWYRTNVFDGSGVSAR